MYLPKKKKKKKRLKGTQRNVDVWQRILKIHSLVVSSQEDMEMWIKVNYMYFF